MSRTRIVKGNITKIIGGDYKRYSKENIENLGSKVIQIGKENGVVYGEPDNFESKSKVDFRSEKYFIFFEIVNKEKVFIYSEEGHAKDYKRNPFRGGKAFYLPEYIYVRFSMKNSIATSYYVPGNPTLDNIAPFNEGMFQNINSFDWREHKEQLKIILHEVFNIYYPNSEFKCSVTMQIDAPVNNYTQAYTIVNARDNWFSDDTIDPIIVFLLNDYGKLMNVGNAGNLFDILGTIDHEYIHLKYLISLKTLLENGVSVEEVLNIRTTEEDERKTIDEQRKSKYYENTSQKFKDELNEYYKNPTKYKH